MKTKQQKLIVKSILFLSLTYMHQEKNQVQSLTNVLALLYNLFVQKHYFICDKKMHNKNMHYIYVGITDNIFIKKLYSHNIDNYLPLVLSFYFYVTYMVN